MKEREISPKRKTFLERVEEFTLKNWTPARSRMVDYAISDYERGDR